MYFAVGCRSGVDPAKHRLVMTVFLLANLADLAVTAMGMSLAGYQEKGLGAAKWFAAGQQMTVYVSKLAITAAFIGAYALAIPRAGLWYFVATRVLKTGGVVVCAAVAWNLLNIALTLAAR